MLPIMRQKPSIPLSFIQEEMEVRTFEALLQWLDLNGAPKEVTNLVIDLSWATVWINQAMQHSGEIPEEYNKEAPELLMSYVNDLCAVEALLH